MEVIVTGYISLFDDHNLRLGMPSKYGAREIFFEYLKVNSFEPVPNLMD